jgi:hypothetical protein
MLSVLLLLAAGGLLSRCSFAEQREPLYDDSSKYYEYASDDEDWYTKFLEAADYAASPSFDQSDALKILDNLPNFESYAESTTLATSSSMELKQSELNKANVPNVKLLADGRERGCASQLPPAQKEDPSDEHITNHTMDDLPQACDMGAKGERTLHSVQRLSTDSLTPNGPDAASVSKLAATTFPGTGYFEYEKGTLGLRNGYFGGDNVRSSAGFIMVFQGDYITGIKNNGFSIFINPSSPTEAQKGNNSQTVESELYGTFSGSNLHLQSKDLPLFSAYRKSGNTVKYLTPGTSAPRKHEFETDDLLMVVPAGLNSELISQCFSKALSSEGHGFLNLAAILLSAINDAKLPGGLLIAKIALPT